MFSNMKISTSLLTGFILVALLVGLVGFIGVQNLSDSEASNVALYEDMAVPISQLSQISTAFQRSRVNLRDMVIASDPQVVQENMDKIDDRVAEVNALTADFEKSQHSPAVDAAFTEYMEARKVYGAEFEKIFALAQQNQDAQALALSAEDGSTGIASRAEQDAIDKLISLKQEEAQNISAETIRKTDRASTTMILIIIASVILALGLGFLLRAIICKPLRQAASMQLDMSKGHLKNRLNMEGTNEIAQMAQAMDSFADDLENKMVGTLNQIAKGDVSRTVEMIDDDDQISPALINITNNIRALIGEAIALSNAATEGLLDTRGNAEAFEGGFYDIINGVNNTLDAVVGPLNVAANYVSRIANGDIPDKITDTYNGDFNTLKNNLNTCIDAINALIADATMLEQAALEGHLETRADASQHGGDFAKIIDGVNQTLDAVISPLNVAADYVCRISNGDIPPQITDSYNGDFNTLKNNLNTCILAINALIDDASILAQAGVDGKLDTRADASKHQGDFAKIINGVNETLDAVVAPVQEISVTLNELSQGNLNTAMVGQYNGDYSHIKEDMNNTIAFLKTYVDEITLTLENIGQGNLDQSIDHEYLGNFNAIKIALNNITTNLSQTMSDINIAAAQVEIGSQQISDGGQALSQGTTEQASSIEELTASIEEVAKGTKQNALNANQANELAISVQNNAELGNDQMHKMVEAMIDIDDSSQNISKIIKVIDDIAFQTNILALNAAVEAARAGQHGKGFAVVAEEVRTLAARSAEAAKETTTLIEGSIGKVEIGTKIADDTEKSLQEILSQIEKVTSIVNTIARASNDQASEIAQINTGIEQVSMVVQTNSATAEESAAASEELSGQAEMLKEMVSTFKLKNQIAGIAPKAKLSPKTSKKSPKAEILLDDKY